MNSEIVIRQCSTDVNIAQLVAFFREHTDTSYISYGEIQDGRAVDASNWSSELSNVLEREFRAAAAAENIFLAFIDEELVGFLMLEIEMVAPIPYATLSDIVVSKQHRSKGIGAAMISRLEKVLKDIGIVHIYAESGISNRSAHDFLGNLGFQTLSQVFLKSSPTSDRND